MKKKNSKKINIGLTIKINSPTENFFANGLNQNVVFFKDLYEKCSNVNKVFFINLGTQKDLSQSPWQEYQEDIIDLNKSAEILDLVIVIGADPNVDMLEILYKKNIKIVKHVLGPEYHVLIENVLFNKKWNINFNARSYHNEIWLSPHIYECNKDLMEVMYRCPSKSVPFIWSPKFLEKNVEKHKLGFNSTGIYENKNISKKISVFEPNLNVVKNSITPVLTAEKLYRKFPDLVEKVQIFCAESIRSNASLTELVKDMDIFKAKKIFFENRFEIAWALLGFTDIVLSHQRDLALNYLYFDAAWLGLPVVHNAHFVKDLGYYYEGFDADQASDKLIDVIKNFDNIKDEYLRESRNYISKFFPDHRDNIKTYEKLINNVLK